MTPRQPAMSVNNTVRDVAPIVPLGKEFSNLLFHYRPRRKQWLFCHRDDHSVATNLVIADYIAVVSKSALVIIARKDDATLSGFSSCSFEDVRKGSIA